MPVMDTVALVGEPLWLSDGVGLKGYGRQLEACQKRSPRRHTGLQYHTSPSNIKAHGATPGGLLKTARGVVVIGKLLYC